MQIFPTPVWIVVTAEVTWLISHGAAGVSYAFLNTTMRREFVKIFCGDSRTVPIQTTTTPGRAVTHTSDRLSDFEF